MRSVILRWCFASMSLALFASTAGADAISSYTANDLGAIPDHTFSDVAFKFSNTGTDGTLTVLNSKIYAFPRTDNLVANPQTLLTTLPPLTAAPYNNYGHTYSYFDPYAAFLNKAGLFAATNYIGVDGNDAESASTVYMATRQPNGTFGPLKALWSTPFGQYSGQDATVLDLNNGGKILGFDTRGSASGSWLLPPIGYRDFFVYDTHSSVRTEIASLLPSGWGGAVPVAIDDQGRILIYASPDPYPIADRYNGKNDTEAFLLTPAGLSSTPLPAPEPTTLATLAVAGLDLAIRRRWRS